MGAEDEWPFSSDRGVRIGIEGVNFEVEPAREAGPREENEGVVTLCNFGITNGAYEKYYIFRDYSVP